jgi:hypothetical protein
VAEDAFVEVGERVEFGGGEQVDHVPAHVADVRGQHCRLVTAECG